MVPAISKRWNAFGRQTHKSGEEADSFRCGGGAKKMCGLLKKVEATKKIKDNGIDPILAIILGKRTHTRMILTA
jgi:hypothetical protein